MTIGNLEDARKIYYFHESHNYKVPPGWSEIGSGGTRTAYLSPDNVVYKVGSSYINVREAKASRKFRAQKHWESHDIVIPRARAWRIAGEREVEYGRNHVVYVLAMEYVEPQDMAYCKAQYGETCTCRKFGTPRVCVAKAFEYMRQRGVYDMFEDNCFIQDNKFYPIDLGCLNQGLRL